MNILVVDDSKTIQRMLSSLIKQKYEHANVDIASNGIQAFKLVKANKYDLILTDWNMPILNGIELVNRIRLSDTNTPIWMITTEGDKNEVVTALRAGVNNYIVKPLKKETLYDKLDILFS